MFSEAVCERSRPSVCQIPVEKPMCAGYPRSAVVNVDECWNCSMTIVHKRTTRMINDCSPGESTSSNRLASFLSNRLVQLRLLFSGNVWWRFVTRNKRSIFWKLNSYKSIWNLVFCVSSVSKFNDLLFCGVFTLSRTGTKTGTGTGTRTMEDNRSSLLSWFRCNVKVSTQFLTTHLFQVPVPISVPPV